MPLQVRQGLARLPIRPFTDTEWDSFPHVIMTNDVDWDPSVLDYAHDDENWFDLVRDGVDTTIPQPDYDQYGNLRFHVIDVQSAYITARYDSDPSRDLDFIFGDRDIDDIIDQAVYYDVYNGVVIPAVDQDPEGHRFEQALVEHVEQDPGHPDPPIRPIRPRDLQRQIPDYERLRPYFGWISAEQVKLTLQHTTQYARLPGTVLNRSPTSYCVDSKTPMHILVHSRPD